MSKSRTRIMVALLALVFSLMSMGVVAEARDGMPPVRKRKPRRSHVKVVTVPPTVTQPVTPNEPVTTPKTPPKKHDNIVTKAVKWLKKPFTKSKGKQTAKLKVYEGEPDYRPNN